MAVLSMLSIAPVNAYEVSGVLSVEEVDYWWIYNVNEGDLVLLVVETDTTCMWESRLYYSNLTLLGETFQGDTHIYEFISDKADDYLLRLYTEYCSFNYTIESKYQNISEQLMYTNAGVLSVEEVDYWWIYNVNEGDLVLLVVETDTTCMWESRLYYSNLTLLGETFQGDTHIYEFISDKADDYLLRLYTEYCSFNYTIECIACMRVTPPPEIKDLKTAWKNATFVLGTSEPYGPLPWGALIDDTIGSIDLAVALASYGTPTSAFDVEVLEWNGTRFNWKPGSPSTVIAVGGTAVNLVSYEYNSYTHFKLSVAGEYVELNVDADGIDHIRLYFSPQRYVIHCANGSDVQYDSEENDFAEVYAYYDAVDDKYVFLVMGICAEGTIGACRYLADNLHSFPTDVANAEGIILRWYDTDMDGIARGNEMTVVATYP